MYLSIVERKLISGIGKCRNKFLKVVLNKISLMYGLFEEKEETQL